MGVLECGRRDCENIMCDRLSNKFGYICWECFDEMVKLNLTNDSEIREFMGLEKKYYEEDNDVCAYDILDEKFPSRD